MWCNRYSPLSVPIDSICTLLKVGKKCNVAGKRYIDFFYIRLRMSGNLNKVLTPIILLLLPIVVLLSGVAVNVKNVWFYVISITWFGLGLMILTSIEEL